MAQADARTGRRRPPLAIGLPATTDDLFAERARSSLLSRLLFSLLGLIGIGFGAVLIARGWDARLGIALIATGLVRFLGTYLDIRGFPSAAFLLGNVSGVLLYAVAILDIGAAAGLELYALLMIAMPPLIMGPQHGRLRPVIFAIDVCLVAAAEIAGHIFPPRIVVPPPMLPQLRAANLVVAAVVASAVVLVYRRMLDRAEAHAAAEQKLSDRLLANILPGPIATRLKRNENPIADGHEEVTILFADMVNFTEFAARNSPEAVVRLLNRIFYAFDDMVEARQLEKIKTIGDAYMVAGGLGAEPGSAASVCALALEMLACVRDLQREEGPELSLRCGIHTGPLVAGVIGKHKFSFDVWGDTVNVASRLETSSEPGQIHISAATARALGPGWRIEPRGRIALKGLGEVPTYFLIGRAEPAVAAKGFLQ